MKKILFIGLVSILFFSCQSSTEVSSPDGTLILRFEQTEDGGIGYRVSRDNNEIIDFSPLGFLTEDQSLENGFCMVGTKKKNYTSVWETVWGEERFIEDRHNELLVSLRHDLPKTPYADWDTRPYAYNIEEREVTADDTIRVRMAPGGGFAMEFKINQ